MRRIYEDRVRSSDVELKNAQKSRMSNYRAETRDQVLADEEWPRCKIPRA